MFFNRRYAARDSGLILSTFRMSQQWRYKQLYGSFVRVWRSGA
jgi:hypothetical protein